MVLKSDCHISLTTWFKDYLYIPLGGSRGNTLETVRNIFIVFIVSGLWHGAQWTFVIWGILHAVYFVVTFLIEKFSKPKSVSSTKSQDFFSALMTFCFVSLVWIFFRAESIEEALSYFNTMLQSRSYFVEPNNLIFLLCILFYFVFEWFSRKEEYPMQNCKSSVAKYCYSFVLILLILNFGFTVTEFIYFQF